MLADWFLVIVILTGSPENMSAEAVTVGRYESAGQCVTQMAYWRDKPYLSACVAVPHRSKNAGLDH